MLQPDPNERATIPEIFSHPWVRSGSTGSCPTDFVMFASRGDKSEDLDDDGFAITYSPAKSPLPAPSTPLHQQPDDDKLPSIAQRSPSRLEPLIGAPHATPLAMSPHGAASIVPTGTPGSGRSRTSARIMDTPLPGKHAAPKLEKTSPRPSMGNMNGGTVMIKPSGGSVSALSPAGSNFKRNPSSTGGSSRARQRPVPGPGAPGSDREKSQAERGPAHPGDAEKLPIAHQKTTRRRSSEHPGEDENGHPKTVSTHALDTIGKKSHASLTLPAAE
jgi:hypothetical protein